MNTDFINLPPEYLKQLQNTLGKQQIMSDYLSRYAHATDASFYSLIPQLVIQVANVSQLQQVLILSTQYNVPVTFRAAGTSVSGQAISDSVLITLTSDWQNVELINSGKLVKTQPGIIGEKLNQLLLQTGHKIGPDPASIGSCKVGGIIANNSSGMCCGVKNNSYHTLESMSLVLADGTYLDTSDIQSVNAFKQTHGTLLFELTSLSRQVKENPELAELVKQKYRLKNTTGYGINALLDFTDPIDILTHLMVGSEGTLGFVADVTLNTVPVRKHSATGLYIFSNASVTASVIQQLSSKGVSAIELMDSRALNSVKSKLEKCGLSGEVSAEQVGLLIELTENSCSEIKNKIHDVTKILSSEILKSETKELEISFSQDKQIQADLWNIRKGMFPIVGANRQVGTTVIIEDVAFTLEHLSEGIKGLTHLFQKHGYHDAIIFGHALDGNMHFAFSQTFNDENSVNTYQNFMADVVDLVAVELKGSLKAEHGTGRNMAPFVETEWGENAYDIMKNIKRLFDPKGILNPDVIISDDPEIHLKNLKAMPELDEVVDKCIECGFCESACPSKDFTLTPRQRIAVQRRLKTLKQQPNTTEKTNDITNKIKNAITDQITENYQFAGIDSCAATGMCSQDCPVGINTGQYIKGLRAQNSGNSTKDVKHHQRFMKSLKVGLNIQSVVSKLLGDKTTNRVGKFVRKISGNRLPLWHSFYPKGTAKQTLNFDDSLKKVVFFSSCVNKTFGENNNSAFDDSLLKTTQRLFNKAGFELEVFKPNNMACCGQPFESKGDFAQANQQKNLLLVELQQASENGKYAIVSDNSSCSLQLKTSQLQQKQNEQTEVQDLITFIAEQVLPKLTVQKLLEPIALHITCSSSKLNNAKALRKIASTLTDEVIETDTACCGFAGDKGFTLPELNEFALSQINPATQKCRLGISHSKTCEIGLSKNTGVQYQSFVYFLDKLSSVIPTEARAEGSSES